MQLRTLAKLVVPLLLMAFVLPCVFASTISSELTGTVLGVLDGSSFSLSGQTVKLACISTPSYGQPGYEESKSQLSGLIQGKTVYLDLDAVTVTDQGKLLCVAFFDYNSTHYVNVNKAMLENNYAVPNSTIVTEFNPATWAFFVAKQTPTPTSTPIATAAPTVTPTPTPFSAPTHSVAPSVPEFPMTIVLLIIGITTLVTITKITKRIKK
jgi:hypothetical protein